MNFNVCIVGCGAMGWNHLAAWQKREDARVVAVFDPVPKAAQALASEAGATAFADYQSAISREGVNMVSICTPIATHAEIACFALAGGRHVLSEKAIALTLEQADAMIAAADKSGKLLGVSYQYRGEPRYRRIRELVRGGAFGGPIFARFTDIREVRPKPAMHRRSQNGGPIIDMAGHYFDLMRFWSGAEPVRVSARGHVFGRGKPELAAVPETDLAIDAADIQVEMSGGEVLSIGVNWGMPQGFATIADDLIAGPQLAVQMNESRVIASWPDRSEVWSDFRSPLRGVACRIQDICGAARGEHALEVSGRDGRVALQVALAALESITQKRSVEIEQRN